MRDLPSSRGTEMWVEFAGVEFFEDFVRFLPFARFAGALRRRGTADRLIATVRDYLPRLAQQMEQAKRPCSLCYAGQ
jgi:hypothetical protein